MQEKLVSVLLFTSHGVYFALIGCFAAYIGWLPKFCDCVSVLFSIAGTSELCRNRSFVKGNFVL